MNARTLMDRAIKLHTVVQYWGERALIVGRAKPIHGPWQYDLLISREGHLVVMPGVLAEDFSTELGDITVPVGARTEAPTHLS